MARQNPKFPTLMRNLRLPLFIVLIACGAGYSQTPESPRGADALVQLAIGRNREFLAARQRITETRALLRQAGVRPAPSIEVESSTGKPLGTAGEEEYAAAYFQPIETAGKRGKRIQVAQKAIELAEAEFEERKRLLAFEVKTRFVETAATQQKLAAVEQLLPVNRQQYEITVARVREGDAARLEQQLFLAEMNRVEAQRTVFAGRSAGTLLELKRVVGLGATDLLAAPTDIPPTASSLSLQDLQRKAVQNRPDLRIARLLEHQAQMEAELTRAEGKPDLTASARYSRRHSQFDQLGLSPSGAPVPLRDRDNTLTFGLSIPIFTARRTEGAVEAALSRGAAARLRSQFLADAIPLEVEAAYRRWHAAQQAAALLQSGVLAESDKNLAVMREAYQLGQLRLLDVLNEQRRLFDTRLGYIDALAEQAQAYAELERAVGGSVQ